MDTSAFYALLDKNDRHHRHARTVHEHTRQEDLVTSLPILTEAWFLIKSRLGYHFANRVWDDVVKGAFELLEANEEDLARAQAIEKKYREAGLGFVDSISFALCEKNRIRKVFTYDVKHFGLYRPSFAPSLELFMPA